MTASGKSPVQLIGWSSGRAVDLGRQASNSLLPTHTSTPAAHCRTRCAAFSAASSAGGIETVGTVERHAQLNHTHGPARLPSATVLMPGQQGRSRLWPNLAPASAPTDLV